MNSRIKDNTVLDNVHRTPEVNEESLFLFLKTLGPQYDLQIEQEEKGRRFIL